MTSTPFNVGLGDGSRNSSRVLRPPGGGHTDIFGGEPEPPRTTGRRMVPGATAAGGQIEGPGKHQQNGAQNGTAPIPEVEPVAEAAPAPAVSPAEQPKAAAAPAPQPAEPQKRVRVPPGGFSSGLW